MNLSPSPVETWAASLPNDLDVVFYGEADEGMAAAATVSTALGMTNAAGLAGGLAAWRATLGDVLLVRTE